MVNGNLIIENPSGQLEFLADYEINGFRGNATPLVTLTLKGF